MPTVEPIIWLLLIAFLAAVVYMIIRDGLWLRVLNRDREQIALLASKQNEKLEELARIVQQRDLNNLRLRRDEQIKVVRITPEQTVNCLQNILARALSKPVTIETVLTVADTPLPYLIVAERTGQELILTSSATEYLERVHQATLWTAKGSRKPAGSPHNGHRQVRISPGVNQLVVDEELRQCYANLAAQWSLPPTSLASVEDWYLLVFDPEKPA
jgi:hypothetical protein